MSATTTQSYNRHNFAPLLALVGTAAFNPALSQTLSQLGVDALPLQQGLAHSSVALADDITVTILQHKAHATYHEIHAGIFYHGVIAGCSCADDPGPVQNEYCEICIRIAADSGMATIEPI